MSKKWTDKQRRFRKWLDQERDKLHTHEYPEDAHDFKKPTDAYFAAFLDRFIDNYSWREDIHGDKMDVTVFDYDSPSDICIITDEGQKKYDTIRWLSKNNYLSYINNHDGTVTVHSVNEDKIDNLEVSLDPDSVPAKVSYSPSKKIVIFNGVRKQMQTGKNLAIFQYLAEHPNERIPKSDIWRLIGDRTPRKKDVSEFSKIIANVRTSVGASLNEIKLEGSVTLHAEVTITD